MPKFSVITPVNLWNQDRVDKFKKTIASIDSQTFKDFEWIIIDDGSPLPVDPIWKELEEKGYIVVHKEHEERVVGYNAGFQIAKGNWFTALDSDDEYDPNYLKEIDKMIKKYPQEKMFNFGCRYIDPDTGNITKRKAFRPKRKRVGHELFGGGNIVNGTYAWSREIYDTIGAFPPAHMENIDCTAINYPAGGEMVRSLFMGTPYDFSAAMQLELPELSQFFYVDDNDPLVKQGSKIIKELGNPWGQDFALFFKYTRKYHSKPFDKYLYIVHPKRIGEIG